MKKITKRILTTMLAVIMLIGAIPAVMSYANENDIFSLDFEDETIGAEVTNTAVTTTNLDASNTVTVEADPLDPNNKVLKITRNNTKKKPTALITFPAQSTAFTIEYRIIFNTTNQCAAVVKGGSLQGAYLVASRGGDGSNGLDNNVDAKNWVNLFPAAEHDLNGWYKVKIDIDIAAYTYNITVTNANGVTKTNNGAALRNEGITSLDSLEVQFGGATATGNLYIDDIRVYDPTQAPVDPEPEQPPVDPTPDPEPEDPTPDPENPDPEDTTELQAAINKVASDLTAAKTALSTAITNGDKALDDKITALTAALDAAKKAYADADTAMKNSLSSKIEDADATLDTAIKAVQKNLDDAIKSLGVADKTNADAIANAITDLNTAIDAAEAAATAADTALKNEINTKIDAADEALQNAFDELAAEVDGLKQEINSIKQQLENKTTEPAPTEDGTAPIVTASIIISCVSLLGCIAFAALYVIDKKKKA